MTQARFTQQARAELLAQTSYYEALEAGLGARFRSEVEAAAGRAALFPEHGKPAARGSRRRIVAGFPFVLVYTQAAQGILIHSVADTRRLPEYWLSRLR